MNISNEAPLSSSAVLIDSLKVSVYTIPTDAPEADGTIEWDSTTMVLVTLTGGGKTGIGYSYAHQSAAVMIETALKPLVVNQDVMQLPSLTQNMIRAIRNNGTCGIAMMAVSAVDNALWDLRARVLGLSLASLLGTVRNEMLLYGSGGFTSYSDKQMEEQLTGWLEQGITHFKIKIGSQPQDDLRRVRFTRKVIGEQAALFVDANGAFSADEAIKYADQFSQCNVTWFEEPVPSSDLAGLNHVKQHAPPGMSIVAGEYGYELPYFQTMLHANAVDILQGDATRCGGISGYLKAGYLCEARNMRYSSHCAPAMHLHASLALPSFFIAEYFHDHQRIENIFFDGVSQPVKGALKPARSAPGNGLILKEKDVTKYKL